jgi:hypothetical protein
VAAAAAISVALAAGLAGIVWQARVAHADRAGAEQRFNDVSRWRTRSSSVFTMP